MEYLIRFLEFLQPYGVYSYWLMFGALIACGFGFPMPEDVILITAGILSARGICDFGTSFAVTMAGVLLGDGVVFYIGRYFGPSVKKSWVFRRFMSDASDQKILNIFSRYGDKVVFIGRFTPGLRMPIFMSAGIYKVPPWKFFALDGFAALISVPVWIWLGFVFGNNLEILEKKMHQFQIGMYGILLSGVLLVVLFFFLKKKFLKTI